MVNPDGCHVHIYYAAEGLTLNATSRLFVADGSLHFVGEFVYHLNKNPDDRDNPENILKSDMYHLPWEKFPARAIHMPPFRTRGMTSNRLLPHAVYKRVNGGFCSRKTRRGRRVHYCIIGLCVEKSKDEIWSAKRVSRTPTAGFCSFFILAPRPFSSFAHRQ